MRRMRAVVLVGGAVGLAGLLTSCDPSVRKYLGKGGKMYEWEEKISKSVCELEKNVTGIPPGLRLCPNGTWPPSITPPPSYPP